MSKEAIVTVDEITVEEFAAALRLYPSIVQSISQTKGKPKGQKRSLLELDSYRFVEAVEQFGRPDASHEMKLNDVKLLVEWKLNHGKFRPTLMSLVSQNDPKAASETIKDGIAAWRKGDDVDRYQRSLAILTKLRGIGPATASLLLAVHEPQQVIFFSDEAFQWLCCGGKKSPMQYNVKEYIMLTDKASRLMDRLQVSAIDIEKVAYSLVKQSDIGIIMESFPSTSAASKTKKTAGEVADTSKKRKATTEDGIAAKDVPLRKSNRIASKE